MKQFIVAVDGKTAVLAAVLADGETWTEEEGKVLISKDQDIEDHLTMPQMVALYNDRAEAAGKPIRKSEWKSKNMGSGMVMNMLMESQAALEDGERQKVQEAAQQQAMADKKEKAAKKKAEGKDKVDLKPARQPRKKKPDTKRAKLIKIFTDHPNKKYDRQSLMSATGFSEGALITNISKLRTDYFAKDNDISQEGGVEVTYGMNIVKHKSDQTWTYEPEGNGGTNFQEARVNEALEMLKELEGK